MNPADVFRWQSYFLVGAGPAMQRFRRAQFLQLRFHCFVEAGGNDFLGEPNGVLDGARTGVAMADGADSFYPQQ